MKNQTRFTKTIQFLILMGMVFIAMQVMNQGLIFIGNNFFKNIKAADHHKILIIGIVQQVLQLGLAVFLTKMILNKKPSEIGFNLNHLRHSFKYFGFFVLFILVVILAYIGISYAFFPQLWLTMQNTPLPTTSEMVSKIVFQSIFPGIGEESLFRGFLITLLVSTLKPNLESFKTKLAIASISGFFFAIAHIYFQWVPFQLTHLDPTQLALAFSCGIAYSFMFMKTKSLVGPVLSHNFSNVSMTIAGYLVSVW